MILDRLVVVLDGDLSPFMGDMTDAEERLEAFGTGMAKVGAGLTVGVTVPLVGLGVEAVQSATKLDSLTRALEAVSDVPVGPQLERLREIARLPGLSFEEAVQGSVNLQAVGFEAMEAERIIKAFGNAVASTGGGAAELGRITTQLTQMASAGKILTADLRPIITTSPLVAAAMQEAFGTISAEQIEELGLSSEEFISKLTAQLETLPKVAAGPKVAFEGLGDSFGVAAAALGEQLLPPIITVVGWLDQMFQWVSQLDPVVLNLAIGFGVAAAALGPVLTVTGAIVALLPTLIANWGLLVAVGGPVLLGVAAFGALTAAGLALVQNWGVIKYEVTRLVDIIHEQLVARFGPIVEWVSTKVQQITGAFGAMYEAVVGHSFVPDMVDGIEQHFSRMGGILDQGADAIVAWATGSEEAIGNFVKRTLVDLGKLIAKMVAVKVLSSALGIGALPGLDPFSGSLADFVSGGVIKGLATGGPAFPGRAYTRNEHGAELFVPQTAGTMVPTGGFSPGQLAGEILSRLGAPPTPMTPREVALDAWYRDLFREQARDYSERF